MRFLFTCLILLSVYNQYYAQLTDVYLNARQSQALGTLSKTAPLIVVIDNEKLNSDAALIAAIKVYWTVGPVKYMSTLEFRVKYKEQSFDPANLYLYNNSSMDLKYNGGTLVTMNPGKIANVPAIYSGFYLTNAPYKLVNSLKNKSAPPYLYFSSAALTDSKLQPIKGFYDLMVKNFNHDILYCQNENNFVKSKKKIKRKNGVLVFKNDSISSKTILLVKEQTYAQEKTKVAEGKKSQVSSKKGDESLGTEQYDAKKTMVVFPEDIQYAVKKNDNNIILYSGLSLYSPVDGSVYATLRGHSGSSLAWLSYVSLAVTAAAVAFFVINTR